MTCVCVCVTGGKGWLSIIAERQLCVCLMYDRLCCCSACCFKWRNMHYWWRCECSLTHWSPAAPPLFSPLGRGDSPEPPPACLFTSASRFFSSRWSSIMLEHKNKTFRRLSPDRSVTLQSKLWCTCRWTYTALKEERRRRITEMSSTCCRARPAREEAGWESKYVLCGNNAQSATIHTSFLHSEHSHGCQSQSLEQSLPLLSTALPVEWEQWSWWNLIGGFFVKPLEGWAVSLTTPIQPPVASDLAAEYQSVVEDGVFFSWCHAVGVFVETLRSRVSEWAPRGDSSTSPESLYIVLPEAGPLFTTPTGGARL